MKSKMHNFIRPLFFVLIFIMFIGSYSPASAVPRYSPCATEDSTNCAVISNDKNGWKRFKRKIIYFFNSLLMPNEDSVTLESQVKGTNTEPQDFKQIFITDLEKARQVGLLVTSQSAHMEPLTIKEITEQLELQTQKEKGDLRQIININTSLFTSNRLVTKKVENELDSINKQVKLSPLTLKKIKVFNLKVKDLTSIDTTSARSLGSMIKNFIIDQVSFNREQAVNESDAENSKDDLFLSKYEIIKYVIKESDITNMPGLIYLDPKSTNDNKQNISNEIGSSSTSNKKTKESPSNSNSSITKEIIPKTDTEKSTPPGQQDSSEPTNANADKIKQNVKDESDVTKVQGSANSESKSANANKETISNEIGSDSTTSNKKTAETVSDSNPSTTKESAAKTDSEKSTPPGQQDSSESTKASVDKAKSDNSEQKSNTTESNGEQHKNENAVLHQKQE